MKEALYWEPGNKKIKCLLCPHQCLIENGKTGLCRVRLNEEGKLYSLNYGHVTSVSMDPVEKKPLYHFHPGSSILSMGTFGCNFHCDYCQNWSISQQNNTPTQKITPGESVDLARNNHSIGIAYTYNEPSIWFEFVLETSELIRKNKMKNVIVTNGYINEEPLKKLIPFLDAANIDLKAFDDTFYRKFCKGTLEPVLKTIKILKENNVHIELTNLIIPTANDNDDTISALVNWIADLDINIPLHFSRYYPLYKMAIPTTETNILQKAREIALKKLYYVYLGNVPDPASDITYCPDCHKPIISRSGYTITEYKIKNGTCGYCGNKSAIIE